MAALNLFNHHYFIDNFSFQIWELLFMYVNISSPVVKMFFFTT